MVAANHKYVEYNSMPSVLKETLGKAAVCRVPDIMHSANIEHSAFSLFPVVTASTESADRQVESNSATPAERTYSGHGCF